MADTRKPGLPANRHDALFRALVDNPGRAASLIRASLPGDIRTLLDDSPPRLVDGSFVDESLAGSQSDRLFEVRLKTGKRAMIYCLIEHKSRPDWRTPLQLLGYKARIWDRYAEGLPDRLRALPPIIPVVYYHGRSVWKVPRSIFDMIDADEAITPHVRSMAYTLYDLGRMGLEDLPSDDKAVFAGLGALKFGVTRVKIPSDALRLILAALPDGDPFADAALHYMVGSYPISREMFEQAFAEARPHDWEAFMDTIAETWIKQGHREGVLAGLQEGLQEGLLTGRQEGRQEGLQEGLLTGRQEGLQEGEAEGIVKGEVKSLIRLLERRFGSLPGSVHKRIAVARPRQVEAWLDAVLDAPDLEAVFTTATRH